MIDFKYHLQRFFSLVAEGEIDIYNEFSVQHELGIYLRDSLSTTLAGIKVQFERPVSFFGLERNRLAKKEIDISVFTSDRSVRYAIELKYPRSGQYPEQMFKACQDIRFLEQLANSSFTRCFFVMVADDSGFYEEKTVSTGIYQYFRGRDFRGRVPLRGVIVKPTGKKDLSVRLGGVYSIVWNDVNASIKYAVVEIDKTQNT
jgi:hypothetical protein